MKRRISLLGSTGSIGRQTLEVAQALGLRVCALAAHSNVKDLEQQVRAFRPNLAAVYDAQAARDLRVRIADTNTKVVTGMEGLCEAATYRTADLIVNAVVGMVGLKPTLAAAAAGKDIALANKETLVAGGALVMDAVRLRGVELIPVDSEHSAIFQCLQGTPRKALKKVILYRVPAARFFGEKQRRAPKSHAPKQALQHPELAHGQKGLDRFGHADE